MMKTIQKAMVLIVWITISSNVSLAQDVVLFPADSIKKATSCTPTVYLVDDMIAKERFGELSHPAKNPTVKDAEELKKYFTANSLTDEKAKDLVFRVHIAFLVTCEGKTGNFEIISKGKGDLQTYANQVLAIVNRMPQNWQPAIADDKPVDCYQVVSFTVFDGSLEKFSFR